MIAVLSPAKTLDMSPAPGPHSQPRLLDESGRLVRDLRRRSRADLQELMGISEKLAELNHARFRDYTTPFDETNAKPAALAFRGDVYRDLEADTFDEATWQRADRQLRILSGLYGLLRPRDLVQAYRLEMGTRLPTSRGKDLYAFWGDRITDLLNEDLAATGSDVLLNLASKEYFRSLRPERLDARVVNVHFREERNGKLRVLALHAKRARGRLASLLLREGITRPEPLRELVVNDYVYRPELSTDTDWTFVR